MNRDHVSFIVVGIAAIVIVAALLILGFVFYVAENAIKDADRSIEERQ